MAAWQQQKYQRKQAELAHLTSQIQNFYGPLYGNRLVYNSSYVCVTRCKHISLEEWLEAAQLLRDGARIIKWRSFYLQTLHPLDIQAVKMIQANVHLFHQVRVSKNNLFTKWLLRIKRRPNSKSSWSTFRVKCFEWRSGKINLVSWRKRPKWRKMILWWNRILYIMIMPRMIHYHLRNMLSRHLLSFERFVKT